MVRGSQLTTLFGRVFSILHNFQAKTNFLNRYPCIRTPGSQMTFCGVSNFDWYLPNQLKITGLYKIPERLTWLVVSSIFLFSIIYGVIRAIDFHIFQDGYCTTNQYWFVSLIPNAQQPTMDSWESNEKAGGNHVLKPHPFLHRTWVNFITSSRRSPEAWFIMVRIKGISSPR